jgi:glycosyltransferase involved in cell wall biosynthesis
MTFGGVERWYRTLCEELVRAGAEVTYLTRQQWLDGQAPRIPGVEVAVVGKRVDLYRPDGTRRTLPTITFGFGTFFWLLRNRKFADVIHVANFPFFSLIGARLATLGSGVSIFVDWYEIWPRSYWREYAGFPTGAIGFWIQSWCISMTRLAVVYIEENAVRLRRHGFRHRVIQLGGLLPQQSIEVPLNLQRPAEPTVVFVGRHIRDKGVRRLPDILAALQILRPGARMMIAGDGPERRVVEAEMARRGLSQHSEFLGRISDDELRSLVASAACTVVPSLREGYGLSVVESMAAGTPVVVASNPENLSVVHVHDGVNGFVTEPSPEAIARGIVRCIDGAESLRSTTAAWFREQAPRMSMTESARTLVAVYAHELKLPEQPT